MVIFEFTCHQNHVILNMRYLRIYMVFVPYKYTLFLNIHGFRTIYVRFYGSTKSMYSKIHNGLTCNIEYEDRYIRYLFFAHHQISNMLFSVFFLILGYI